MKIIHRLAAVLAVTVLMASAAALRSRAADGAPASAPPTLWSFLGIPQGCHKIQDALVNPFGRHPKWERKPALKRIADPANLQSDNPAIKAAAKIKAEADLAPQKIKAIRYLATICCGCAKNRDEVKEALLSALDDCTEAVRYEAALALCGCAGDPCTNCNRAGCCDAKIMNKLQKVSEGQDAQGCWLEPSARVRAAAANALGACRQVRGPTAQVPAEAPKKGEVPTADPEEPDKKDRKGPAAASTTGLRPVTPAGYVQIQDRTPARLASSGGSVLRTQPRGPAVWPSDVRFQGRIVPSASLAR
jgi:hypothetical protein